MNATTSDAHHSGESLLLENRGNGRSRHAVPQTLQRALEASVAPARILGRHAYDQAANLREHVGASRPAFRVGPLPGDELPVPAENRVGRDDRRNLCQKPPTERRAESSQAPPFVVSEPYALIAQARLQNAVLFPQVLVDLVLLVLEPADKKRDDQVQRTHASSLRQQRGDVFGHYGLNRGTAAARLAAASRYPCGHGVMTKHVMYARALEQLQAVLVRPTACPAAVLKEARKLGRESKADALVSKARLGFKYFEVKVDGSYRPE
jgi:hypothetical protein